MDCRSRRDVLRTVGGLAAVGAAGCGSLPATGGDERIDDDGVPPSETATTQFRGGLRRRGVFPEARVPGSVETAWSLPELNTGDHTAAKASPMALPSGDVLVAGDTGELHRLGPDGTVAWTASVADTTRGIHGTPAVANGAAYIGAYDGALSAIDVETGDRFWRMDLGDAIGSSPAYHDGTVYVAVEYSAPSGAMFGLDAVTGDIVWEDGRPTDHPHSTCAIDRTAGRLVVGSNDGNCYAWSYPDLEREWVFETDGAIKGPVATADGSAFFGSWDDHVYRVALGDGREEWAVETGSLVMSGPAVDAEAGVVYVGSHDSRLYALDMESGEPQWRYDTGGRLIGCPTVTAEHVLVGSHDGHCYAVERDSGRGAWRVAAGGNVSSTPLVVDGAVYVADRATEAYLDGGDGAAGRLYKLVAEGG
ncbi:cell surface protein [Halobacteriales archaeon QH_10_67_22]|nr:MAG: cell surface protein [Halobacteriales archaeon QH_10_67_22]